LEDRVETFSDATWNEKVLAAPGPVVVDFWAEWCAPCRMMSATVDALAEEFEGRARVGKLNVDENRAVSERYQIRGIPTMILFKGGEVKEQVVGVTSKENLERLIERHLDSKRGS
jgi:thioredoxin 1